ncbi:hypothetical protein V6N11_061534 [Hibiscus sabdariffa]|uniref:Homeobox protein knotted-1-like 3 n=1 Tax=Hibiscus sabdariffa TaxID=183260 RepID=A0ABR2NVV1_9ROSI
MAFHPNHLSQDLPLHHFTDQQQQASQLTDSSAPNWLNTALLRSQQPQPPQPHAAHFPDPNFLNLHTTSTNASESTLASQAPNQWLSRSSSSLLQHNHGDAVDDMAAVATAAGGGVVRESMVAVEFGELKRSNSELNKNNKSEGVAVETGGGGDGAVNWQNAKYKAEILAHPFWLSHSKWWLSTRLWVVGPKPLVGGEKELDQFMTHYVMLLCSFKEQLQQHVRVHAMEAVMACWEIEQSLQSLTGVSPGEGTGATMSDDDEDRVDSDANLFDGSLDGPDSMGFGPLVPTESERSLMERVRQELKHELKQGYKEKIVDIREEILRKRRAGKLPGDTTSVLKAWWQSHSKWPYPTEEDKARLVQETGLQLKQINNWFINQRKRNWHSNPSTSTVSKNKRKKIR